MRKNETAPIKDEGEQPDAPADSAPTKVRSALGEKSYQTRRRKRIIAHVGAQKNAAAVICLEPGLELYTVTAGQFSFINVVEAIVNQIGEPMNIDVSSWTVAEFEVMRLKHYLDTGKAARVRFITDRSFVTRHPDEHAALIDILGFQNIRVLRCHCKFVIITSDSWNIALRTSANLNANRRLENYEISDDPALAGFMVSIVDEIFKIPPDKTIGRRELRALKTCGEGIAPNKSGGEEPDPDPEPEPEATDPIMAGLNKLLKQSGLSE